MTLQVASRLPIHAVIMYLLNIYYAPDPIQGPKDRAGNNIEKAPTFMELILYYSRRVDNKCSVAQSHQTL